MEIEEKFEELHFKISVIDVCFSELGVYLAAKLYSRMFMKMKILVIRIYFL